MYIDTFLHTLGAEVTEATRSPMAGSEFIRLSIIARLHLEQAIQEISSRIASLEHKLHPTYTDDLLKALLRACLKAMQAEQQAGQKQKAFRTPVLSARILEVEDPETGAFVTLQLLPGANNLMISCFAGSGQQPTGKPTGKPLAALQLGPYKDELEVLYWDASMIEALEPKHLVLAEHIQGQEETPISAPRAQQEKRYTVLAFTEQGMRGLKVQAQGRIEQHREDIERLNELRTWLLENGPDDEGPIALVAELTHHLETMFDSQVSELEERISVLEATVADLELGGY